MAATTSARCRHGLRWFVSKGRGWSRARSTGQRPTRRLCWPRGAQEAPKRRSVQWSCPARRVAARERDQMRLLHARERLAAAFLPLVAPYRLDSPVLGAAQAHAFDGLATHREGPVEVCRAPAVAEREQHLGAGARVGAGRRDGGRRTAARGRRRTRCATAVGATGSVVSACDAPYVPTTLLPSSISVWTEYQG